MTSTIALSRVLRSRPVGWLTTTTPRCCNFSTVGLGALPPRLPPLPDRTSLPPPGTPVLGALSSLSSPLPPAPSSSPTNVAKPLVDLRLPTKHSRKRLPTIITDYEELLTSAETILTADEGSLFTYNPTSAKINYSVEKDRDLAWSAADTTVQTVEAILRGFAWHIPGTCWHRYLPPSGNKDGPNSLTKVPYEDIPMAMEELIDRLYKEGLAYMKLRAERLEELHRTSGNGMDNDVLAGLLDEPPPDDNRQHPSFSFLAAGGSNNNNSSSLSSFLSTTDSARPDNNDTNLLMVEEQKNPYLHEFALPGPTTAMYDALLDVAAVTGDVQCADNVNVWHELAFTRHQLDGGCTRNRNVYTVPTALTFNALIRYAVTVPVPDNDLELRDTALALAFSTYQTLDEVEIVHKNAASVFYTLQVIGKYMPPSRIRGNIAAGVFHQARYRGLINQAVIDAYLAANTPSNSAEDDIYIRDNLSGQPIPPKWKRESKKYRYNPREDVY